MVASQDMTARCANQTALVLAVDIYEGSGWRGSVILCRTNLNSLTGFILSPTSQNSSFKASSTSHSKSSHTAAEHGLILPPHLGHLLTSYHSGRVNRAWRQLKPTFCCTCYICGEHIEMYPLINRVGEMNDMRNTLGHIALMHLLS